MRPRLFQNLRHADIRRLRWPAAMVLLAALAGCVPTMTQPPPAHENGAVDPRLAGIWWSGNEEPGFAFIGSGDDGAMHAALASVLDNGRLEVNEYEFYRAGSRVGDLLMVADDDDDGGQRRRLPVRYRFDGENRFQITWLAYSFVKKAIVQGELEGRVDSGGWVDEVIITAPHNVTFAWLELNEQAWDTKHSVWFYRLDDKQLDCLKDSKNCPH